MINWIRWIDRIAGFIRSLEIFEGYFEYGYAQEMGSMLLHFLPCGG